ncbi:MAG: hypothetical protein JXJ04_26895 [Spirochaetales bacterium]|nr:hypothetical protein [Spirochaetales bacterium]
MNINLLFWNPRFWLHRNVIILLIIIIVIAIPFNLGAIETVLHQFRAAEPDPQLEDLLYLSAGVAFSQKGFFCTRKKGSEDFILLTEYTSSESVVAIRYTLFGSGAGDHALATREFTLTIDYNLTEQITRAIMEVLQEADIKPVTTAEGEIDGVGIESSGNVVKNDTDSVVHTDNEEPEIAGDPHAVRFNSSVSALVVMLLGDITEYLHYSAAGSLIAGITWPRNSWSITLGVKLLFMQVFNDADVAGGPLYISLAGLNLQLGIGSDKTYRVGAGVSGGAAFISVQGEQNLMTKTVPYVDVSVYSRIRIGKYITLGGEVSFLTIFDNDLLIMGVSPALSFGIEV